MGRGNLVFYDGIATSSHPVRDGTGLLVMTFGNYKSRRKKMLRLWQIRFFILFGKTFDGLINSVIEIKNGDELSNNKQQLDFVANIAQL